MENRNEQGHKKGGSALAAAAMGRSATQQVDPHSNSGLAGTGTNISYEGATAPGAGGSVGTGYASGQEATGEHIATNSDYEQNRAQKVSNQGGRQEEERDEDDQAHEQLANNGLDDADDLDDEDMEDIDMDEEDEEEEL